MERVLDDKEYFERSHRGDFEARYPYFSAIAAALIERFHPRVVLDIGCAGGDFIYAFREQGIAAYGIDPSEYGLRHSVKAAQGYLCQAVAEALPFGQDSFDLVTAYHVVEHLQNPNYFIGEARRILKPGGILFITTTIAPLGVVRPWQILRIQRDTTHVSLCSKSYWVRTFEARGFRLVGDLQKLVVKDPPSFWGGQTLLKFGTVGRWLESKLAGYIRESFLFELR